MSLLVHLVPGYIVNAILGVKPGISAEYSSQKLAYSARADKELVAQIKVLDRILGCAHIFITPILPALAILSTCNLPFPTNPKFAPDATAIRSSKNGEKAIPWCENGDVLIRDFWMPLPALPPISPPGVLAPPEDGVLI